MTLLLILESSYKPRKLFVYSVLVLLSVTLMSCDQGEEPLPVSRTFGGQKDDIFARIIPCRDFGFIVAGYTESYGAGFDDLWIVRFDEDGNKLWERFYGGPSDDRPSCIVQDWNGDFLVAGLTWFFHEGWDSWLVKTDSSGNLRWMKTYGDTLSSKAAKIFPVDESGYLLFGSEESPGKDDFDYYARYLDSYGNPVWQKRYGTSYDDFLGGAWPYGDGYILAGYHELPGTGKDEVFIVKISLDGTKQWDTTIKNGGLVMDGAHNPDGSLILCSSRVGENGNVVTLTKVKHDGDVMWQKDVLRGEYYAESIIESGDNGFILTGSRSLFSPRGWVMKLDQNGNSVWLREFDHEGQIGAAISAAVSRDRNIMVCGYIGEPADAWIAKLDQNGNLIW
ncbi:MAG: hypothetical protein GXO82_06515 [Chlorobi bacterium]|nr:hypothetical protein [Chlorobiota bacterium]